MQRYSAYFCLVKQLSLFFASVCYCLISTAQKVETQASWQQQTDYKIRVQLDPDKHLLNGYISINYTNHSPDTLKNIWLHAWPNAYKNTETAYALQQLKNNEVKFHFSDEKDKGWIDSFNFTGNGIALKWQFDSVNIDILNVTLNTPLLPGQNITISTPFIEKLPYLFSRGGVNGSFFALTQWYPKPAVYDVNGWNTMPYLDQGEFYSEYGSFDVSITLPEKYLVAATGNLQTESELKLLNTIIESNNGISNNHSNELKTLSYHEDNIHDFAWFADTTFRINKNQIQLDNGDIVNTWAFESKKNGAWVHRETSAIPVSKAVKLYSNKIGYYPYKNCTLVIGSIIAGGGMEYPTITVCESNDEETTIHEVGHNWFYGMLGTNERKYPWMDESINTFFEQKFNKNLKGDSAFFKHFNGKQWTGNYETLLAYLFTARQGISQALNLPSDEFSDLNYGSIVYAKGPLLFAYLEQQLGDTLFAQCFKNYFQQWQYKHPLPGDMQSSFEQTTGMRLNWFFHDLLNENNAIDFKSKHGEMELKGSLALDSFLKLKEYNNANPYGFLPETNYNNNGQKKQLLSINIPWRLPTQNTLIPINACPILGYNYYDQLYAGAAFFNRTIFRKKLEYMLIPAYAFGSKSLVGYGKINGLFLPVSKTVQRIEAGVQGQSFGLQHQSTNNQYYRINPYFRLFLNHNKEINEQFVKVLQLNLYRTGLINSTYNDSNKLGFPDHYFFNYINLSYRHENKHPINNFNFQMNMEAGSNYKFGPFKNQYLKIWLTGEYKYQFARKKFFKSRIFGGFFLYDKGNITTQKFFSSGNNGAKDYLYNEPMIGRSERFFNNNIWGHQLINVNGSLRNIIESSPANNWLLSSCNEISLPGILPFRIYADFGIYKYVVTNATSGNYNNNAFNTTSGIIIPFFKETLQIYIPIFQSNNFKSIISYNNYNVFDQIGFILNLNKLEPTKLIDNFRM